jgi:hypothetical protein
VYLGVDAEAVLLVELLEEALGLAAAGVTCAKARGSVVAAWPLTTGRDSAVDASGRDSRF